MSDQPDEEGVGSMMIEIYKPDHDSESMWRAERAARQRATHDEALKQWEATGRRELAFPTQPEPIGIEEMRSLIVQATTVIEAMMALRTQMEGVLARAEGARDLRTLDEEST